MNVVVLRLVIESVIQCSEKFYDTVKVCIRDIYDLIQIVVPPSMTAVSFNRYYNDFLLPRHGHHMYVQCSYIHIYSYVGNVGIIIIY